MPILSFYTLIVSLVVCTIISCIIRILKNLVEFIERFKFFDFKLYEGKINKILRWTGTLERLSHKYKWFDADPEFKKRFKDVFFNFVKLINSFTYAKQIRNIQILKMNTFHTWFTQYALLTPFIQIKFKILKLWSNIIQN